MAKPNDTIAAVVTVLILGAFVACYLVARYLRPFEDSSTYLSTSTGQSQQPSYSSQSVTTGHSAPQFPHGSPPIQQFDGDAPVPLGPLGGPFPSPHGGSIPVPPPQVSRGMDSPANIGGHFDQGIGGTPPNIVDVEPPGGRGDIEGHPGYH
ncbi:hypothetical protein HD806DRAFT_545216 [Xylariaceae sp. AK1471]|nr:hypothetical protein HD806DRAFT_545216 [Xylariaceae sp. AK1471]